MPDTEAAEVEEAKEPVTATPATEELAELAELYGSGLFPVAVERKTGMPNLAEAAAMRNGSREFGFGVDSKSTASVLRYLADEIDSGSVLPQSITDAATATVQNFTLHTMTVVFAHRHVKTTQAEA